MGIITLSKLNRALYQVQTELDELGFYDEYLQSVDVYLVSCIVNKLK